MTLEPTGETKTATTKKSRYLFVNSDLLTYRQRSWMSSIQHTFGAVSQAHY